MNTYPFISIIIPVYNAEKTIEKLIKSLINLNYPKNLYEIIFIDNNSTDNSEKIIRKYPFTLLKEKKQSSYASRNTGIKYSQGDILTFVDADCKIDKNWLKNGVETLLEQKADLAGGNTIMLIPSNPTLSELYDCIIYSKVEYSINNKFFIPAGNLFVKKIVFQEIGLFPEIRSGADAIWTNYAIRNNKKIIYIPNSLVYHYSKKIHSHLKRIILTYGISPLLQHSMGIPYLIVLKNQIKKLIKYFNIKFQLKRISKLVGILPPKYQKNKKITFLHILLAIIGTLSSFIYLLSSSRIKEQKEVEKTINFKKQHLYWKNKLNRNITSI